MDFTTKKILNKGRLIISIISGFLNAITCLIIQNSYGNARNNILSFYKLFPSKPEESSSPRTQPPPSSILSFLFTSTPYSSPWMYSTNGDLLGTESGVFMSSFEEFQLEHERKLLFNTTKKPSPRRIKKVKKEYPPAIPSWRGKLPGDVPWSLSRHYVDGRLILKEESMEYYEYLEATRENGRLVLNLLVLKGNITCHDQHDKNKDMNEQVMANRDNNDTIDRGKKKILIEEDIESDFMNNEPSLENVGGTKSEVNIGDIFANAQAGMTSSSSMLGVPSLFDSSVDSLVQPTSALVA